MSSAGVLQKIELLGQNYEVQTELVDAELGAVRTVIFHGGQAVANMQSRLRVSGEGGTFEEAVEGALARYHQLMVDGFVMRTLRYEERRGSPTGIEARGVMEVVAPARSEAAVDVLMPPLPEDPALADGLDVRRLFGEVRLRVGLAEEDPLPAAPTRNDPLRELELLAGRGRSSRPASRPLRVETAAGVFAWATREPRFTRVRVDEQVRFHIIKERIEGWVAAGRDHATADGIWGEIVKFCGYLAEINLRADLIDFDRRLVAWGLSSLRRKRGSGGMMKPLTWLLGRDAELDLLLGRKPPPEAEALITQLARVGANLGIS